MPAPGLAPMKAVQAFTLRNIGKRGRARGGYCSPNMSEFFWWGPGRMGSRGEGEPNFDAQLFRGPSA